jgi:hypothetical protein
MGASHHAELGRTRDDWRLAIRPRERVSEGAHPIRDAIADVVSAREGHRSASSRSAVSAESHTSSFRVITSACFRGTPGTGRRRGSRRAGPAPSLVAARAPRDVEGRGRIASHAPWNDQGLCEQHEATAGSPRSGRSNSPSRAGPSEERMAARSMGDRARSAIGGAPPVSRLISWRAGRRRPISSRPARSPPAV